LNELGPLPAGRHGYSREQVAHHQRERLIAGLATAVAAKGYGAVTLTDITREARVSRRVFYENFESKEQCFLAAFDVVVAHLRELAGEAADGIQEWPARAVAATRAVLSFLASEPDLARLLLVESRGAGPAVLARFNEAVGELAPVVAQGREAREADRRLPDSTEDSVLGSLVTLVFRKVAAEETAQLGELLPECTEFVLAPYVGAEEASRLAAETHASSP
jgi:AcrR family transcriptional regulator